jgi:hypothetical protein
MMFNVNTTSRATLHWDIVKEHLSSKGYRSRDSQLPRYIISLKYHERFECDWEECYQNYHENTSIVANLPGDHNDVRASALT